MFSVLTDTELLISSDSPVRRKAKQMSTPGKKAESLFIPREVVFVGAWTAAARD